MQRVDYWIGQYASEGYVYTGPAFGILVVNPEVRALAPELELRTIAIPIELRRLLLTPQPDGK